MILLPDMSIRLDGVLQKLSLQDPYTLNRKLITKIEIVNEPEYSYAIDYLGRPSTRIQTSTNENIIIGNEEGYFISVSKNNLHRNFLHELNNFFFEQRSDEVRVGEYGSEWTIRRDYCVESYIRDLQSQCDRLSLTDIWTSYTPSFRTHCEERLRNQGRLQEENTESQSNSWTYLAFGTSIRDYNGVLAWSPSTSSESSEQQKKYIHDYNYKPTYIKHYMQDEDKSSLLLGAEIEVAGNDKALDKEEVVKKCIQIMNGSDDDTEDLIYSTHDSTAQIELDTMPCTLNYHKQRMNYKELFKYLDELGYKGHDCENAGLHIHADRSYLGSTELKQQLVITKILYILEKFNDEICVIARRNHEYSKFVGKEEAKETLHKLYSKYNDSGKKVALNLKHKDTIEFRCFRSTLKYETFILTLEFVKNIIDYAKQINIEEIELIQWSDLMNTFSEELKEYYNDRLEKEESKKIKDLEEGKKSSISLGSGNLYFNIDGENVPASYWYNNINNNNSRREEIETRIDNLTSIELKKKEIKSLKKKINNCVNYMEKVQLQQELSQAQKDLKMLKKRMAS